MKKLLISAFLLGFMSCDKEPEPTPPEPNKVRAFCLCGSIRTTTILGDGTYLYLLINNCSGNKKDYYTDSNLTAGYCFDEAW